MNWKSVVAPSGFEGSWIPALHGDEDFALHGDEGFGEFLGNHTKERREIFHLRSLNQKEKGKKKKEKEKVF
jgi:hypothetical protein